MGWNALVDTEWLSAHISDPDLRVLDGSWYLPSSGRNARAEFEAEHLPGAQFFDIDAVADHTTDLPHMLPSPEVFAETAGALGIGDDDLVIAYDGAGLQSAGRVWWTFRAFGHERVAVLDGGLPRWKREGRPLERTVRTWAPKARTPRFRPELVRSLDEMKANVATGREQVLDARSRGRFAATEPEPRPGVKGGRIPGSKNLPFGEIITPEGTMLEVDALRSVLERLIDPEQPVVTSCGSGITAAILALALHRIGRPDAAVYDGSWAEWGGREDTPIER